MERTIVLQWVNVNNPYVVYNSDVHVRYRPIPEYILLSISFRSTDNLVTKTYFDITVIISLLSKLYAKPIT